MSFGYQPNTPVTQFEGDPNAKVIVITSVPAWEGTPLSDAAKSTVLQITRSCGIRDQDLAFVSMLDFIPPGRKWESADEFSRVRCRDALRAQLLKGTSGCLVPLDRQALEFLTEHGSIDNWQCSIIPATKLENRKTIPIYHPERLFADQKVYPFIRLGWQRVAEEMNSTHIKTTPRIFHIAPTFEQAMSFLGRCIFEDTLSIDVETAWGQITVFGVALSPTESMAIPVLPEDWPDDFQYHKLWTMIADVLASPAKKVFQNFIYDCSYFSRYGLKVRNLWHDTMPAQKFLHPELPMGLDTIARVYTREPYWKDEGKDWRNIGDKRQFWIYNCKDTTVTLEAALAQRVDLRLRGLESRFDDLVMSLTGPASEMCWRGLPVDAERRTALTVDVQNAIREAEIKLNAEAQKVLGKDINSRSPLQVKLFLKGKGYKLPMKKGKETSDATALMKLLVKYPQDPGLKLLLELSEKNKLYSSYLKPEPYSDGRMRFSLNLHGTEPGRWSCSKDSFDRGFNAQTISAELKKMFKAPPGWLWFEVDLKQADSRFVAWDAPEPTLIKMYSDNVDIHRFVASRPELFNKPPQEITKDERQLGKKVGHASNYGMRGARLSEICLLEMGISLSPQRADAMLEGYHRVFPGIRMWQQRIASEIRRTKKLATPMGRERIFYGRLGDDLYREAYAYKPPSVVCDVINSLIKFVDRERDPERLHFALQAHDAAIMLVREDYFDEAKKLCFAESEWNPKISLPGGVLQIPIEAKAGEVWGTAAEVHA